VVRNRSPFLDLVHSPQVQACTVAQRETSDDGKCPRSRKGERVTKVEQCSRNGTDEDGEFEPGKESALGG